MATIPQIKAKLDMGARAAITDVEERAVYRIIKDTLDKFYGEYTPKEYKTTLQVLNSLVRSGVMGGGGHYKASVYFDVGALSHPRPAMGMSGEMHDVNWSEGQILDSVMKWGTHGVLGGGGTAVWTESHDAKIAPELIEKLVDSLRAHGVPVH